MLAHYKKFRSLVGMTFVVTIAVAVIAALVVMLTDGVATASPTPQVASILSQASDGDGPARPAADANSCDFSDVGPAPGGRYIIPAGLPRETSGPSKSDGIYSPTTNREIYQKISSDYQEIVALTNEVDQCRALPAPKIMLLYEAGYHTRIGNSSRTLRGFARDPRRSDEFPDSLAFYGSATFLDTPISNALRNRKWGNRGEQYTPSEQRYAIQKGVERILYHWAKRYVALGVQYQSSGLVDEAWAVYVGWEKDGDYPNSLAAIARDVETDMNRTDAIDTPLRQALERARQAAANARAATTVEQQETRQADLDAAAADVYSRFNALFYLASVHGLGEGLRLAQAGDHAAAGDALVKGYHSYLSIQPEVAKAVGTTGDKLIVDYYQSSPVDLTVAQRNEALAALNRAASALLLAQRDLVTSFP